MRRQDAIRFWKNSGLFWHGLTFNVIWIVCVVFQVPILAAALALAWLECSFPSKVKWQQLTTIALLGIVVDFLFTYLGFLLFQLILCRRFGSPLYGSVSPALHSSLSTNLV